MATQSELYSLAIANGLTPERAKVAAAVGMAESGGNANAHNTNALTGDNSYGYWQINMLGALGPERRKKYGLSSNEQLFDPATNARVMAGESNKGANFVPWSAYNSGAYLKFMGSAVTDQTKQPGWLQKLAILAGPLVPGGINLPGASVSNPVTSAASAASSAADALGKSAKWVSNSQNWLRVGYVAGGSILVVAGLVMVLQSTSAGRAAVNLFPAGRVASVVKSVK